MNAAQRFLQRARLGDWPLARVTTLARFAAVGLVSSAAYAAIMVLATSIGGIEPRISSVLAYLSAMVLNFPLQRGFTFASGGDVRRELPRYLGVHLINLLVSVATVHLVVEVLGLPVAVSIAAVVVIIPLMQFLALEAWVFLPRKGGQ